MIDSSEAQKPELIRRYTDLIRAGNKQVMNVR